MPISYSHHLQILSTSSIYLFRGLPLFHVPSILAVSICFGIRSLFSLSICPQRLNLTNIINFLPLGTYPVSPYFFFLSTFIFPLWDHIFSLQSSFRILSSSRSLSYDTSVASFNLQYVPVSLKPYGSCLRLLHRPHAPPFFPLNKVF